MVTFGYIWNLDRCFEISDSPQEMEPLPVGSVGASAGAEVVKFQALESRST